MPERPMCAYCGRQPVDPEWAPFCSERCQLTDLGRWLTGGYRIPDDPPDEDATDRSNDTSIDRSKDRSILRSIDRLID